MAGLAFLKDPETFREQILIDFTQAYNGFASELLGCLTSHLFSIVSFEN